MKILHISTNDSTGAGLCAYRIHQSLLKSGIDSKLLVLNKTQQDKFTIRRKSYVIKYLLYRIIHKLLRILNIYICEFDKVIKQSIEKGSFYSLPVSIFDLSKDSLVKEADIVHLHWIDGFVDCPSFLKSISKPIIWTLHDESLFYGTAHYHDSVLYDDVLEKKYSKIKHEMILSANNLDVVFLSQYFFDTFRKEPMLLGKKLYVINNSVDSLKFHPIFEDEIRKKLGITSETIILSFIAGRINDPHKGLNLLLEAISFFPKRKIKILAIGGNKGFISHEKVISVGMIKDSEYMSKLLSASNYFVMPSLQEAFSQAPLEAMACGVPAIVFPVSGTEELINKENGIRCKGFGVNDLVEGLNKAFNTSYDRSKIRQDMQNRFSPEVIAGKYIEIYKSFQ